MWTLLLQPPFVLPRRCHGSQMQLCRGISLEELRLLAQRLRFLVTSAVPAIV